VNDKVSARLDDVAAAVGGSCAADPSPKEGPLLSHFKYFSRQSGNSTNMIRMVLICHLREKQCLPEFYFHAFQFSMCKSTFY